MFVRPAASMHCAAGTSFALPRLVSSFLQALLDLRKRPFAGVFVEFDGCAVSCQADLAPMKQI